MGTAPSPAGTAPYAWSHVVVLAGEFATTRGQFERITEPAEEAARIPTVVLHDPPGQGDTVVYRAHYCPAEQREDDVCTDGGAEPIALGQIDPGWTDEVDLGDASTYERLLAYVASAYPSSHLLVTLKGRSRFGHVLRDDDAGDDAGLTVTELRQVLAATRQLRDANVDVLALATSSSASIEYAMALQSTVDVLVGTQQSTGAGRSEYFRLTTWSALLRDYPEIGARELGRRICRIYRDPIYPSFDAQHDHAISALDLGSGATVAQRLTDLFGQLHALGDQGVLALEAAGADVWHYGTDATRADLGTLLDRLVDHFAEGPSQQAALRAYVAVQNAVVDNAATGEPSPTGLSIFFPAQPTTQFGLRKSYRDNHGPFIYESGWQGLLKARLRYWRDRAAGCGLLRPPSAPGAGGGALLLLAAAVIAASRRRARPHPKGRPPNDPTPSGRG